jgi:hypothetical protein
MGGGLQRGLPGGYFMNAITLLTSYWHWNITALVIGLILIIFHFATNGYRFTIKSPLFLGGILLLVLVTFSPLDYLGHHYLFSAHMIQHIVLLLVIPPLLLAGTDKSFLERLSGQFWFKQAGSFLFYPVISWVLGIGAMWIWHIPRVFDSICPCGSVLSLFQRQRIDNYEFHSGAMGDYSGCGPANGRSDHVGAGVHNISYQHNDYSWQMVPDSGN